MALGSFPHSRYSRPGSREVAELQCTVPILSGMSGPRHLCRPASMERKCSASVSVDDGAETAVQYLLHFLDSQRICFSTLVPIIKSSCCPSTTMVGTIILQS